MGPHRLEILKPLLRFRESPIEPALTEFMKIEKIEDAKNEIIRVFRDEHSNPDRKGRRFSPSEINIQVRHLSEVFDYAKDKHDGKNRLTGEEYIFHPAAVTFMMLMDPHIPTDKLAEAADTMLCHDVLEDTDTYPSELRERIWADATGNVILLSKNMKIFDDSPWNLWRVLKEIDGKSDQTTDEIELHRWAKRRDGTKIERLQLHMDEIFHSSDLVKRGRGYDKLHNLKTLPALVLPPDAEPRSEEDQRKVENIWNGIFAETRDHIFPIVLSLGPPGYPLFRSLRKVYKEKKPHQELLKT